MLSFVAVAALAGAAFADQPTVLERNHAYVREVPHAATCKPYGYTFTVSYHYDVERRVIVCATTFQATFAPSGWLCWNRFLLMTCPFSFVLHSDPHSPPEPGPAFEDQTRAASRAQRSLAASALASSLAEGS